MSMEVLSEDSLRRRRQQLEADRSHLIANRLRRDERNSRRIREAAESFADSKQESNGIISGCFVDAEAQRALLFKLFNEHERQSLKAGRYGVSAVDLQQILEALTGCRPLAHECQQMMTTTTICFDQFLTIYSLIRSGELEFSAFTQTLDDFKALCSQIPDSPDM